MAQSLRGLSPCFSSHEAALPPAVNCTAPPSHDVDLLTDSWGSPASMTGNDRLIEQRTSGTEYGLTPVHDRACCMQMAGALMQGGLTQKAQSPQQLIPSGEPSQSAQLLSRNAVSGFTDIPNMWGIGWSRCPEVSPIVS